jgi:hypothetical protein
MKIIELILDDKDTEMGVYAVSVVDEPAIEENFVALNKHSIELATIDKEKKLLMGPALIPNKQIYRKNSKHGEFYIYFSEETVRKASEMFFTNGHQNSATYEHDKQIDGMTVVESWIIDDSKSDKSRLYNFDLPVGTWMISMKVNNDQIWNDVKDGKVKGFSIEGYFADKYEMAMQASMKKVMDEEKEYLIEQIKKIMSGQILADDSYNDYPSVVKRNAQRGILLNERNGNKCATQVGKIRAQQLANGEKVSMETIKRMYSYLSRAEVYYNQGDSNDCGFISYLLWGGKAGLTWSESKIKEYEKETTN